MVKSPVFNEYRAFFSKDIEQFSALYLPG